ncbi:MAG: cupin domain-containing protein [Patescibacteria group bacterium]|jgi:mannose-6-phosphate isomerase-like protein (cupin superfamily)
MVGYIANIEEETDMNDNFRKVLFTGPNSQLVVMSLKVGEDIGMEVHDKVDQFIRIEDGKGKAILDGEETGIESDWAVVIPAGTEHNIVNTGDGPLKLYTIYSPANHPEGTIHVTKAEAEAAEAAEHGEKTGE